LSVCFFLNVHFVYVFHSHHSVPRGSAWTIQPLYDAVFGTAQDAPELKLLSLTTATVSLVIAGFGWTWLNGRARLRQSALTVAEGIG
jgi:hypothetical protein